MDFLKKLQNLDVFWRKFILWFALGIGLGFLAIKNFQRNLRGFKISFPTSNYGH